MDTINVLNVQKRQMKRTAPIGEKEKWLNSLQQFVTIKKKRNYLPARLVTNGVHVEPKVDYKKWYKLFKELKIRLHTFAIPLEKPLKAVFKKNFRKIFCGTNDSYVGNERTYFIDFSTTVKRTKKSIYQLKDSCDLRFGV